MRTLVSTRLHGALDYVVGAALIAAPWIFQFSEHTAATVVPIVLGALIIAQSLVTDYELSLARLLPMPAHLGVDVIGGAFLAASPWIFGFADETANVWVPHLVVGIVAVLLASVTDPRSRVRHAPASRDADETTERYRRAA